jgi:hypothetical protein
MQQQYIQMKELVLKVENDRLKRVRRSWNTEQLQAQQSFDKSGKNVMTPEYVEWLYHGV